MTRRGRYETIHTRYQIHKIMLPVSVLSHGSVGADAGKHPKKGATMPIPTIEIPKLSDDQSTRFWLNVWMGSDCWEWTGRRNKLGYGCFKIKGRQYLSHRISFQASVGPIPPGMLILHACDNPGCVRPSHLMAGTARDNVSDMFSKGRGNRASGARHMSVKHPEALRRGKEHPLSKLTATQVLEIRAKYIPRKYTLKQLAKEYGVAITNISSIVLRKTWKHI